MSLRDELQAIYDEHGKLTPELVVKVARPKNHPLHGRVFNLTPKQAAEGWYLQQAHELIASVKVTYREPDGERGPGRVRAWHAVPSNGADQFVYEPADKVAADPFVRQLVLQTMEREWRQLLARYETFQEFLALVEGDVKDRKAA